MSLSNQDDTKMRTGVVRPDSPYVKAFLEKIRATEPDTYQYLDMQWDLVQWVAAAVNEDGDVFALTAISPYNEVGLPLPTFTAIWTQPHMRRRGVASYLMKLASAEVFSNNAGQETTFTARNEQDIRLFCKASDKGAPIVMRWIRNPSEHR